MGNSSAIEIVRSFHSKDRELYKRLVIDMGRDLSQCTHMMALWLWLDEVGYPSIIPKMLTLPDWVVNIVADEAVCCLNCIHSETPPPILTSTMTTEIPVTQALMEDKQITLSTFLYPNRHSALRRTTKTVNNLCFRVTFEDIMKQAAALALENNYHLDHDHYQQQEEEEEEEKAAEYEFINLAVEGNGDQPMTSSSSSSRTYCSVLQQESVKPSVGPIGPPHAAPGSSLSESKSRLRTSSSRKGGKSFRQTSVSKPNDKAKVPRDKRLMFITFSRGFPVTEQEVRDFLVGTYGNDCIEDLCMGKVDRESGHSLYALLVFRSVRVIAAILDGKELAKLVINGKRARARLFL